MSGPDETPESFEEIVRWIAREVSRSVERVSQVDLDEIAGAIGVDPARAREWVDTAGRWLHDQAGSRGGDAVFPDAATSDAAPADEDPVRTPGPHPLDLPTDDQG